MPRDGSNKNFWSQSETDSLGNIQKRDPFDVT
jgi:hypothetical protein